MKPNNTPIYVHKESNHPPNIIKNIPESVNKRLSSISSNEIIFNEAAPPYQDALGKSGYSYILNYKPVTETPKPPKRKRNITWFNPPFSDNVDTNIGRKFFLLLDNCFPASNALSKILNRNTVKLSYSCMPNIQQSIANHNKSILSKSQPKQHDRGCNSRDQTHCPLNGNCLSTCVIYQATVTREDNQKKETYIGLTENTFKIRFNNHMASFRKAEKRNTTALSEYIWKLKDDDITYALTWKIVSRANPYSTTSKLCNLCNREKYFIISKPNLASLNKRNELANACRHRKKYLLCNVK